MNSSPPIRTTTPRTLLLITAMLTAGLFVGTMIHNSILAEPWNTRISHCADVVRGNSDGLAFTQCMAPAEARRVIISLITALIVLAAAAGLVLIRPRIHERQRQLQPMGTILWTQQQAFARMASEAGLKHTPTLMRGRKVNSITDPYAYGIPYRYRVTVPPKLLANADNPRSAALLRHEIAHIANRDVTIAWLTRSTLYILAPVLLAPLIAMVMTQDTSTMTDYVWRALVLIGIVEFIQSSLLRSREFDADLGALRCGADSDSLIAAAMHIKRQPTTLLRRLRAHHPSADERLEVIAEPWRAARFGFMEALSAAYLATLILPVLRAAAASVLAGSPAQVLLVWLAVALPGTLLGVVVGLGSLGAEAASRLTGAPSRISTLVTGSFIGAVLGQLASFANIGLGSDVAFEPASTIIMALSLAGTSVVVASMAAVACTPVGIAQQPSRRALICTSGALLFTVSLWAGGLLGIYWRNLGWSGLGLALEAVATRWTPAIVAASVACVVLVTGWRVSTKVAAPRLERPAAAAIVAALTAGNAGGLTIVTFRILTGPFPGSSLQRPYLLVILCTVVATGTACALLWVYGLVGVALSLASMPIGVLVVVLYMAGLAAGLGAGIHGALAALRLLPPGLSIALLAIVPIALLAPFRLHPCRYRGSIVFLTALVCTAMPLAVLCLYVRTAT